ncbi:WGR domain-containing protein [Sphingomonas sp. R1]|uniref:WGR domain-containing protein n=1 Tax=Sphingomonas sp. R1 TaxID=399176 RepID=UPI0022244C11|nr:WGR domain-containing protein [Sphingomonas sp. R1]UYY79568.1 WGR domain-containing protein [Sphingomonas sp. R1]
MLDLPTKLIDWRCELQARCDAKNMARSYEITVSKDLFGCVLVELAWGRIGAAGSRLRVSFQSEAAARQFVERTLSRRASAPRRIGVEYQLVRRPKGSKFGHQISDVAARRAE